MSKLLVVEDEQSICWGLSQLGKSIGHEVATASSAESAFEAVEHSRPDVIVLDVRLPGMDGITAIEQFRQRIGQVPIIIITAYGDLETAVKAVRNGAFEYIVKPFNLEKVRRALTRALTVHNLPNLNHQPLGKVGGLIGHTPAMQEVFGKIALASTADASILLCGESGVGKELAARAIHQYSDRAENPFVAVNVASFSQTLAESELFGHVRGAFTGAEQDRVGLLVQANGGTLFLDEVADIPLPTQVKLLRALEHGEVTPVGSGQAVKTDFRIVSATHQDLLEKVEDGSFRHDLYFRLGAFRIDIPPLRERGEDIIALAEHFLRSTTQQRDAAPFAISEETAAELMRRPWDGNVRELRNAIEYGVIVARGGAIEPEHLPDPAPVAVSLLTDCRNAPCAEDSLVSWIGLWAETQLADSDQGEDLYEQLLQLVEPPLLAAALKKHRGQCAAAARQLGMHRTTLRKKLDEYGIDDA